MDGGLYELLTRERLLIPHTEVEQNLTGSAGHYTTLLPRQLPFISYPCEWAPGQLKDAGLLTLSILRRSIGKDMILKDASPWNVQFPEGKPLFIDTLSFERYEPSLPWAAYRQFCECFLLPLYLHQYHQQGIHKILVAYPDGIPAQIALSLLPLKSRLRLGVWLHVILPARVRHHVGKAGEPSFDRRKLHLLIDNLEDILHRFDTGPTAATAWSSYYHETMPGHTYLQEKERLFREMIGYIPFASALDLGGNNGHFSKILADKPAMVISVDDDWACTEALYRSFTRQAAAPIHPLCIDIANPTPASGWHHTERLSFTERASCDLVTALALIHHLVLGRNIPFRMIAGYFAAMARSYLIIEFIPATDEKAKELTRNKPVVHAPYDVSAFEQHFGEHFTILQRVVIPSTDRILYLMKKIKTGS
jgi:hypothetical protein